MFLLRTLTVLLALTAVVGGLSGTVARAQSGGAAESLVFDSWVPGSCSPNGQPQGQCPPGERLFPLETRKMISAMTFPRATVSRL